MMFRDIGLALDPARYLRDAGIEPDPWQERALRSRSKRKCWNVHRQGGKTTTSAALAVSRACGEVGSLTVVVSPSQRQSSEWLRGTLGLYHKIGDLPPIVAESATRLEFYGGSRIVSLPSSEGTIRGYAKVGLLIFDEASRIESSIIAACRPMIALGGEGGGDIVALSTPNGRRGEFFEWFEHGGDTWERERVTADECGRIDGTFLAEERRTLGDLLYRQEYECAFVDNDEQIFPSSIIDRAFSPEVAPLW